MLRHAKSIPKTPVVIREEKCYIISIRVISIGQRQLSDHVLSCKSFSDAYTLVSILLTDVQILEKFVKPDIVNELVKRWKKDPSKYDKYTFKISSSKVANLSKFKENQWISTIFGLYDDTETLEEYRIKYEYYISACIAKRTTLTNLDSLFNSFPTISDDLKKHKKIP